MDRQGLLDLYDRELRKELEIPGMRKDEFPNLVRFIRPISGMNYIHYSKIDAAELDSVIMDQISYLSKIDQPFSWHVFEHDQQPELERKLIEHGFGRDDEPDRILYLDLRSGLGHEYHPTEWTIRRIEDLDQIAAVAEIEQQIYGGNFDWLVDRLSAHLNVPGYLSIYAAYIQDKPVSVGWIYFHLKSHFASLFGGGTLQKYRGMGIYHNLVDARVREAAQRGYQFAVTGASEMSYPILLGLGFKYLTSSFDFVWDPRSKTNS